MLFVVNPDFIVEVRIKNEEEFMEKMAGMEHILRCSLVSHDGALEYRHGFRPF